MNPSPQQHISCIMYGSGDQKSIWHSQQTVLAITLSAIVESSPPQNPSNAMAKDVPPVLDGDGMIAQSNPVAVLPQSVL